MPISVHVALGAIAGILVAECFFPVLNSLVWISLLLLCVVRTGCERRATRWYAQPLVIAALLGATSFRLHIERQRAAVQAHHGDLDDRQEEVITGRVVGMPRRFPGRQIVILSTPTSRILLTIYSSAEEASVLMPGDWLRVRARLKTPQKTRGVGAVDQQQKVIALGADLIGSAALTNVTRINTSWSWWAASTQLHRWAASTIAARPGSKNGRHLVAAVAIGDRGYMPKTLSQVLRTTGVAHLLAVSGMHLAAVVTLVYYVAVGGWSWLPWRQYLDPKSLGAGAALLSAFFFTAFTGARPSTCRALMIAIMVLVGIMIDRRIRLLHAISWAAFSLLLWSPMWLWDPGVQMSFAATTALAVAMRQESNELHYKFTFSRNRLLRLCTRAMDLVRATFWAIVITAPISLFHFGQVSWLGLVTNLAAIPVTTMVVLPGAIASLLLVPICEPIGFWLLDVVIWICGGVATICYTIDAAVPARVQSPLCFFELLLWSIFVFVLLQRRTVLARLRWFWVALIVGVILFSFSISRSSWHKLHFRGDNRLRITFVDVGQGDAAVVELPNGRVWLIDGGGLPFVSATALGHNQHAAESPARRALLPYLRHRRIRNIDLVIVSHPHPDHYIGLQAVAKQMPIGELWSAHRTDDSPGPYRRWLSLLKKQGTLIRSPRIGLARQQGDVVLHVLWPRYRAEPGLAVHGTTSLADPVLTVNDNSLVLRIDFAGRRILFAGDIEAETESLLVANERENLSSDVIKVPHHGSPTSSTTAFVRAIGAQVAIISCGLANSFGFPSPGIEAAWRREGAAVLRTDRVGSVTVQISSRGEMTIESL